MDDLELVLTAEQFSRLVESVKKIIAETEAAIHTIDVGDILSLMGYSSLMELNH